MRWPKGPPHLALNPPNFFCFVFAFLFFVLFIFFVCFGGFKGQVRWPKGPPHLALRPSLFVFLVFLFCSLFLFFWLFDTEPKTLFFSPRKGLFYLFSVFLFLSPFALLGLPLFLFLFLSLSFFFFSFFLPSCLCSCFLLVPCLCLFFFLSFFLFLLCFSFMKGTTSKYSIASSFGLPSFLFFKFPVFLFHHTASIAHPTLGLGFLGKPHAKSASRSKPRHALEAATITNMCASKFFCFKFLFVILALS